MNEALELMRIVESRGGQFILEGPQVFEPQQAALPIVESLRVHKMAIRSLLESGTEQRAYPKAASDSLLSEGCLTVACSVIAVPVESALCILTLPAGAQTMSGLRQLHGELLWMRFGRRASRSPQTARVTACCLKRTERPRSLSGSGRIQRAARSGSQTARRCSSPDTVFYVFD